MSKLSDCYEAAAKMVLYDDQFAGAVLVHGVGHPVLGPHKGKRFAHAWVELGGVSYDHSNGKSIEVSAELYEALLELKFSERYTREQARGMILQHKHWGPWEPSVMQ